MPSYSSRGRVALAFAAVTTGVVLLVIAWQGLDVPTSLNRLSILEAWISRVSLATGGILLAGLGLGWLAGSSRAGRWLGRGCLLGASILVSCALLELVLHLMPAHTFPNFNRADPLLDHSLIPGAESRFVGPEWDTAVHINSLGLRDDELRPDAQFRILMLGDSFTWGYGVEQDQTFSAIVERNLRQQGVNADVINAGVVSYSPVLYYLYVRHQGVTLEPDLVVVNFDMSDVQDDLVYESRATLDADGLARAVNGRTPAADASANFFLWAYHQVRLVRLVKQGLEALYARVPHKTQLDVPWARDVRTNRLAITRGDTPWEAQAPHWQRSLRYLEAIRRLGDERGFRVVLTTYPYGHQVSRREWSRGRHNFGFGHDKVSSDRPARVLGEFAAREQLPYLNLFPAFRQAEEFPLYFPYDGHFTPQGQALMGRELTNFLLARFTWTDEGPRQRPAPGHR